MAFSFSAPGWSIRTKSLILVVGFLVVLSVVYGAFTVQLLRREVAQAHDRLRQTARIVAAEIDAYVESGAKRLETVTQLPGLAYGLQTIQEAGDEGYIPPWTTLHYLFFKSPVFTGGVFLLDRGGKVLWTEPPGLGWLHQTLTDVAPVAKMYRTKTRVISGVLGADHLLAQPHVVVGLPIQNERGDLQGVLAGVIDLSASEFGSILEAVSTSGGRFAEIVDQNGLVLAGTDPSRLFNRAAPTDAEMMGAVTLEHAPWRVVAGQPPSLALAPVWHFQRELWLIGVALLLVTVAVAAPILNGFVGSLKHLTDAAETMSRGDLSQPVGVGARRDELATLAHAFEQLRVELGRSRRTLEQRLEEREGLIQLLTRTNEELHAAQARLLEAERFAAIGEMSAAVAHGIRNPVAGIKLAAQVVSAELPDHHPLRDSVNDVIEEADKLEARIKTLLDFARPFEPHPTPQRIERIVADAVSYLRGRMSAQKIELDVDLPPTLPEAQLDSAQIEQVLLALLSNAAEAMPGGGRITITGCVDADGHRLCLDVADTGPGVPPQHMGRLFELFFTTKSSGTGLGLPVAKKIVERHGGTITVASEVGKGTRFTIELPLAGPGSTAAPEPASGRSTG
jgi:signal transduction histidine kinase